MWQNHFKIAIRALLKFRGFTFINLAGLSLGLTAGIFMMIYAMDEFSFDQFHEKKSRLYRVNTIFQTAETGEGGANETNGWPIGKILQTEFPEVEAVLYSRSASFLTINYNDKSIRENAHFASPEFFHLFSFPLVAGNADKALAEPFSVVISEKLAQKYFAGADPLNKTLTIVDTLQLLVTGIMKNIPANSHIQADMLVSFSTFQRLEPNFSFEGGWGNINMRNYVLLKPGADFNSFAAKAKNLYMERVGDMMRNWGVTASLAFEPMDRVYLHTKSGNGLGPIGSIDRVYLLIGVSIFVILLACINFVNLSTARSVYRSREVGLRKVIGSTRWALMRQFISESFLLTLLAFLVALALTGGLLPFFNELVGKDYRINILLSWQVAAGMAVLVFVISLLAGYYPAWVISSLKPADVLKGKMQSSAKGVQLRRGLVVFQFVISVSLVVGTLVVLQQLDYMQQRALGFSKDAVLVINTARVRAPESTTFETFKNELASMSAVESITYANALPGVSGWSGQVAYPEGKTADAAVSVEYMAVDANYLKVLGLSLVAGRDFDERRETDRADGLLINETAAGLMGWGNEEAIGKRIASPSGYPAGEVLGVVKDYHQEGLQHQIGPVVMDYNPESSYLYAIRYRASDTRALVTQIGSVWSRMFPGFDYNYFFLDENFGKQYQAEERLGNVFTLFAVVTVLIACIGLLGLVSFMVVARTKEIGVRKVLGANVLNVVQLLSREFLVLVAVANVVAVPLAWYAAEKWLQQFAYRMEVNPFIFLWTLLAALALTWITVSYQTVRAAVADPVKALRYE